VWHAVSDTARVAGDDLLAACLNRLEAACKTPGPAGVLLKGDPAPLVSAAYRDAVWQRQEAAHAALKQAAQQAAEATRPRPAPAVQTVAEKPKGRYHAELTSREMRALERQHVWVTRASGAFFAGLMYVPTTPEMLPLYIFSLLLGLPLLFAAGYGFWPRKKLLAVLNQAIEGALSGARVCDDLLDAKRRRLREIDSTPYLNNLALFVRADLAAVPIKKAGSVPGIGPRTLKALSLAGIETAADLAAFSTLDAVSEKKKRLLDAWYADREARATERFRNLNDERRALENDLRRLRQEKNDHLHKREELLHEHEDFPPTTPAAFVQELLNSW
jgi:predicted flap endonuclease-1-like 5' DNA nuclease